MTIQLSKKAKQIINAPIPQSIIRERSGGGNKKLHYLGGSTVIDLLNEAFDYMWDWQTEKEWVQESIPFVNTYKNNELEEQKPVAHVRGTLTVHLITENDTLISLKKTGYGSKSIMGKQNDQESIFKAAGTDALKKAASLLGIGAELYREEEEQAWFEELSYEDPWTDELREKFKEQFEYIEFVREKFNLDEEGMQGVVYGFSNETSTSLNYITPDNMADFYEYLKEQVAAVESKEEEEQ